MVPGIAAAAGRRPELDGPSGGGGRPNARERAVLDALPVAAYVTDASGAIVFLSAAFVTLTGFDPATLSWPAYLDLVHPDDAADRRAAWSRSVLEGARLRHAFRIRTAGGAYRNVLSDAQPLRDVRGRVTGWLGTFTEIDELKAAQGALAEREAELRALVTTIPGVTWIATSTGDITFVSERSKVYHASEAALLGRSWYDLIHPDDLPATREAFARAMGTGEPYEREHRVRNADGAYRWTLNRALPVRDLTGAIVRWAGVSVDVDERRRAFEERERFERIVGACDDFVAIAYADGCSSYVNAAGGAMLGLAEDLSPPGDVVAHLVPEDRERYRRDVAPAVARDGRWAGELRFQHARSRATIPVATSAFALHDAAGEVVGIAMIARDLREERRREIAMRSLADAARVMNADLGVAATIENVVAAIAHEFASTCIFDRIDDDGSIRSSFATRRPRLPAALLERSAAIRTRDAAHPATRALRDGTSTLAATMPDGWAARIGLSERDLAGAEIDVRSALYVAVRSVETGRIVGSLTCYIGTDDLRGGYAEEDLRFAEELARRAALALDHAEAYERQRRIAVTLQQAMLPTALPNVPGLRLSADYRPGSDEATVGGDWYDAFELADGRIVLAVGDVIGSGLTAATTMSKLRQSIRAAAFARAEPGHMLAIADHVTCAESRDVYATAFVGVLDLARRTFGYASGGHPSPLVRSPDGRVEPCAGTGLMLGIAPDQERETTTIELAPGSSLVFFTDGLTEATRDVDAGFARVARATADPALIAAPHAARALIDRVLDGEPSADDAAALVATLAPA